MSVCPHGCTEQSLRTRKGGRVKLRHDVVIYGNHYNGGRELRVLAQRGTRIRVDEATRHGAWIEAKHLEPVR